VLLTAATAFAFAGPIGPREDVGSPAEALHPLSACDDSYPFALVALTPSDLMVEFRPDHAYGSPTMVYVVEQAAEHMALMYPDAPPLLVGDLGKPNGGNLPPHITHGDGRSADLGLFGWTGTVEDLRGGFPKLSPQQLDVERTWALVDSLLQTGQVEHILLDQRHIDRLAAWLLESGRKTPEELARLFPPLDTPRLWSWTGYVRHAESHADHLHVRVMCEGAEASRS
jgi:hypothetical protein